MSYAMNIFHMLALSSACFLSTVTPGWLISCTQSYLPCQFVDIDQVKLSLRPAGCVPWRRAYKTSVDDQRQYVRVTCSMCSLSSVTTQ